MRKQLFAAIGVLCVVAGAAGCAASSESAGLGVAQRVELSPENPEFNNLYHADGFYFAGQPTEKGLRDMAAKGVTTVINLRTSEEMTDRVDFDEPKLIDELGMTYVHLPMSSGGYSTELVDSLAKALSGTRGDVLLHCASSNRVGVIWANYLNCHRGLDLDDAIERGRAAGMTRDSLEDLVRKVAANCPERS